MVVLQNKVRDWWNSWSLPTLNLWGPHATVSGLPATVGTPGATSATGPTTGSKVPYSPSMLPKVKGLIDFATEQTGYKYSVGTAAVLAQMLKGTFKHSPGEKPAKDSLGQCYKYVRIALTRAQIVDGYLADRLDVSYQESASKAGTPLLNKGFVEVTDEVPDARWAATGDVIVYEWSPPTWEARKKKNGNPSLPNHGHIDIRSEETYISDFMPVLKRPAWIVGDATQPTKYRPEYVNIRLYRKFYDPTPTCRIRAFLACLREFECQAIKNDADRYRALNAPLPTNPKSRTFSGFDVHPWDGVPKDKWPVSTAAGAYQITCTNWRNYLKQQYLPDLDGKALFTPAVQDRLAVIIMEAVEALVAVRTGDLASAVAALTDKKQPQWTSLPGGKENSGRRTADGKPMDMTYLKSLYDKFLAVELAKFGIGAK